MGKYNGRDMLDKDGRLKKLMKHKPWLLQRLEVGNEVNALNPFGNVLIETQDLAKLIGKVVIPGYMGAAEFEHGVFGKALNRMFTSSDYHVYEFSMIIPIYVVCSSYGDERYLIEHIIRNHLIKSLENVVVGNFVSKEEASTDTIDTVLQGAETWAVNETSKNDYGSFLKVLTKMAESHGAYSGKLVGWFDVAMDYAWFIDRTTAKHFNTLLHPRADFEAILEKRGMSEEEREVLEVIKSSSDAVIEVEEVSGRVVGER